MRQDLIRKYESQRVPRYTSYPTAPHFTPAVDGAAYGGWLENVAADMRLSLYLHLPYCHSMCWYCGCHTKITRRYAPIKRYLDALGHEVELVADRLESPRPVGHIHWGGGTPTMASPEDFRAIMARLRARFAVASDAAIAVEIDPRTLDGDMVEAMASSGVNRASLGVQCFDPKVQKAINREQSFDLTRAAVLALRTAGIRRQSLDLIYGLPHQTVATCERTVAQALELEPDRLSVFGYAHLPSLKKHQRLIDEAALPSGSERVAQFEAIARGLEAAGYRRIGLDHFARAEDEMARRAADGTLKRNFQGYTTDQCDALIGFGASAIGSLPQGYVQNTTEINRYVEAVGADRLPVARGVALSADDHLRRALIETLMCRYELDVEAVARAQGVAPETFMPEFDRLHALAADGLVTVDGWRLRIPEDAQPLVRSVAAVFDAYLTPTAGRHAVAL